jgi:hypothetical protein
MALAGALACGDSDVVDSSPRPAGWDPAALAAAERLAGAIRAAEMPCDGFAPWDHAAVAADYAQKLPVPAAMARCIGPDGEDLTFEIFADAKARDDFLATKLHLLCERARMQGMALPALPYVEGDAWLVEPDEGTTADRLAPILHGKAKRTSCSPADAPA